MQAATNPHNRLTLDYSVVAVDGDLLTLQLQVPAAFAATLPNLLASLQDSFKLMSQKAKVAQAVMRSSDPEEIKKREEYRQKLDATILHRFDLFVSAGNTPRESVRLTRDYFRHRDFETTCYIVELVARQNGRFRKTKSDLIVSPIKKTSKANKGKHL